MSDCSHPDDRIEWRKWPKMGRLPAFQRQCLECLAPVGREVDPLKLPDDVDPGHVMMATIVRKKRGAGGLGGDGNSKRREYARYMRSSQWRGPKGIQRRVLERDGYRCQDCGDRANTAAHIRYPENIWDTRPEDCKASCKDCNDAERQQRITRAVLGP